MDFGDRSDNPFFTSFACAKTDRKRAWKSALGLFLIACAAFVVLIVVSGQSQKWLVHRLTHEFDRLGIQEKRERLTQLAELGSPGIEFLTQSMVDPDLDVSRISFELLQRMQNDWSVLEEQDRNGRSLQLVAAIESISVHLPDDRTGWATRLLQQTLLATVDRPSPEARQLYRKANRAMDLLSLSGRSRSAGPRVTLADESIQSLAADPGRPTRLEVRAQPLPVDQSASAERWTQWPPPQESVRGSIASLGPSADVGEGANPLRDQPLDTESASVYRSGAKLQPVEEGNEVLLNEVQASEIRPVTHLVESPLQTYDDRSVIRMLGSEHAALREKSKAELARRGFGETDLAIAIQVATGDTQTRMDLIDGLAQSSKLDPRPWLLMMLDDPARDVRLRAISVLATMDDPAIAQRLRLQLADERDPTVAARIRRILKLR